MSSNTQDERAEGLESGRMRVVLFDGPVDGGNESSRVFIEHAEITKVLKGGKLPYEKEGVYILARSNAKHPEYHIAKIISEGETSNPSSVGNASTKCLRYYKSHEYLIAEKEPLREEICRKCQSMRYAGG